MHLPILVRQTRFPIMGRYSASLVVSATLLVILVPANAVGQAPTADQAPIRDFQQRVNNYLSLQKKQNPPNKPSASADKLAEQKEVAADKIKAARPAARRGDIFTPPIAAYFKKQIAITMRGPTGAKIRASMLHAEPLPDIHVEVNAKYPKDLPYQSTPPTLLMNLPPLPKELQYRVVGSTLLLYDISSGLIVDLIPGAIA